jgi:signal peptidase
MDPRSALTFLLRAAVTSVLVSSFVAFFFVGILPRTGAYRTLTVLSGSMRPAFAPGDMVVAKPISTDQVKLGDVVVYQIPVGDHHVESHRIVQILERHPNLVVRTKGDANDSADPWTAVLQGDRVWTVRHAVPYVGQAIVWLRSPLQHKLMTFFLPGIVAFLFLRTIWRRRPDDANVLQIG